MPPLGQTIEDETQADVVRHLRDMVYYNITQLLLSNATDVAVLRKAVDCSLVKNEQLSTEPTFANAVAIAEMCRLGRAAAPSWITDTLRNVMTNIVQDASTWNELALAILASDCIDDQRKLQWVIRLLDTLIVIGSDKSITDRTKLFANATQNGLRRILSMLWWTQADDQDYLSVPETEYMLSFALEVGNKYPTEQQQVSILRHIYVLFAVYSKYFCVFYVFSSTDDETYPYSDVKGDSFKASIFACLAQFSRESLGNARR